ncbi:hypothetical protein L596_015726 [Steinernema carpocapsae]|uniref:Uncharacterized protein n=1 Tax=Steinernema carpocapsae TaxID=34508 RepID=A0A4U5NH35_STECR|nr:hypothetical protein L596_015726 [Steinernema carpocapsae]
MPVKKCSAPCTLRHRLTRPTNSTILQPSAVWKRNPTGRSLRDRYKMTDFRRKLVQQVRTEIRPDRDQDQGLHGLCSLTRQRGVISTSLVANDRSVSLTNNVKPTGRSTRDRPKYRFRTVDRASDGHRRGCLAERFFLDHPVGAKI